MPEPAAASPVPGPVGPAVPLAGELAPGLARRVAQGALTWSDEVRALRRDLHAHPELSRAEVRTTRLLRERLEAAGLAPRPLPGTGLVCDVGPEDGRGAVALRADLDALALDDVKDVPWRSVVPGACHACGHDVHTAVLLGAGLVLADLHREGLLASRVHLLFQPAEETMPGGALDVLAAGGLEGVRAIYALHCDPRTPLGRVGVRPGPITAAADRVSVRLTGPGGHTARPHATADLVYALGKVVTDVPAVLARRVDPRAGLALVWGTVQAGHAPNAIPGEGAVQGTLRCLDAAAWIAAPELFERVVREVVAPYGVGVEVGYQRGVPPVVNDAAAAALLGRAARGALGAEAVVPAEQSLGGEDFAWYLERVPGALARLGTTREGEPPGDLHQPTFDPDERALDVGVRLLVAAALLS